MVCGKASFENTIFMRTFVIISLDEGNDPVKAHSRNVPKVSLLFTGLVWAEKWAFLFVAAHNMGIG